MCPEQSSIREPARHAGFGTGGKLASNDKLDPNWCAMLTARLNGIRRLEVWRHGVDEVAKGIRPGRTDGDA